MAVLALIILLLMSAEREGDNTRGLRNRNLNMREQDMLHLFGG
jgi:hypothetical protein